MMEEEADDVVFDSVQLIKKKRGGASRLQSRDSMCQQPAQLRKHRAARTCCLCAAFLCLGLTASVTGPTMPYFKERLQVGVGKLSYMYAARCFGYLIGSVAGGVLFDQFSQFNDLLLGGGLVAGAVGLAVAPFATSLLLLCCVLAVTGLANGFLYSGGVTVCSRQWGTRRAPPYLQGLYFAISVGAFVAPLLSASFLGSPASPSAYGAAPDSVTSVAPGRPLALPKRALSDTAPSDTAVILSSLPPSPPPLLPANVIALRTDVALPSSSVGGSQASAAPSQPIVAAVVAAPIGAAATQQPAADAVEPTTGHDDSSVKAAAGHGEPPAADQGVPASSLDATASTVATVGTAATTTAAAATKPTAPVTTLAKPLKPKAALGSLLSQDMNAAAGKGLGSRVSNAMKESSGGGDAAAARAPASGSAQVAQVLTLAASPTGTLSSAATASIAGTTGLPSNLSQTAAGTPSVMGRQTDGAAEPTAYYDRLDNATSEQPHAGVSAGSTTSWQNATGADGATAAADAGTLSAAATASAPVDAPMTSSTNVVLPEGVGSGGSTAAISFPLVTAADSATTQIDVAASNRTSNFSRADSVSDGRNESANGADAAASFVTTAVHVVEAESGTATDSEMTSLGPLSNSSVNSSSDSSSNNSSRILSTQAYDHSTVPTLVNDSATDSRAVGGFEVTTGLPTFSDATYSLSHFASAPPPSASTQTVSPSTLVGTVATAVSPGSTSDTGVSTLRTVTFFSAAPDGSGDTAPLPPLPTDQAVRSGTAASAVVVPSPAVGLFGTSTAMPAQPSTQQQPPSSDVVPVAAVVDRHTYSAFLDDVQIVYLTLSACLLLVALCFALMSLCNRRGGGEPWAAAESLTGAGGDGSGIPGDGSGMPEAEAPLPPAAGSVRFMSRILALVFIMCMLYVGIEVTFGQLLATYAAALAALTERRAALLTAAFWGLFVLGRALSVVAARRVSPAALLSCGLTVSCVALLLLSFATGGGGSAGVGESALWIGAGLLGAGLAPIFPTCFAWTQQYLDVGGKVASVLVGGSSLGGMVLPVVVGHLLERADPTYMMYVLLGAVTACSFVYALAWYVAAVAFAPNGRLCNGSGGGSTGGYEAVATNAQPVEDDDGRERPPPPAAGRLMSKRNTGHKRVSFRLLDDDSDKDM